MRERPSVLDGDATKLFHQPTRGFHTFPALGRVCLRLFVLQEIHHDHLGKYEGDFVIAEIRPSTYSANGRMVIEIRALLGGMTLSNIDALSGDEARQLSPQEVDPIDEEAQAPAPDTTRATAKSKSRSSRDPLVDTTPFGSEPGAAASEASADDAALFGALWPLGDVVKLDATVDRRVLRQQRDRLGTLGYEFAPLSQDWHLAKA